MAEEQSDFGLVLRRYRSSAGLTQEELATRAGLSLRGVSDLERGLHRSPYSDTVERLAAALGLNAAQRATLRAARRPAPAAKEHVASSSPLLRSALPASPTSFVGRERELREVRRLIGEARLLTVTGAGGVGKTRLAVEAARGLEAVFSDGVPFVALAGVSSPHLLASALAAALGVPLHAATEPSVQLASYLRDKHLLLVLDNFEHLLEGSGLLTSILHTAPRVTILLTSRERLNLQEEWVLPIEGLPYPDSGLSAALDSYPAVRLFVQRAHQLHAQLSLADDAESVIAVCQRVDGMPLALELAATWLRVMPCDQIVLQIDRSLDFLSTPVRNVPDRHRSLRAVFDQSWNLLSDTERQVLAQLSVFRGGFDLEAAAQVAGALLWVLASLADKSLIRVNGLGRYDLHEFMRQYLSEKLTASSDRDVRDVSRRHFRCYASLAEQADAHVYGPHQEAWYDRLEIESDNLAAALTWSLTEVQPAAGLRLAVALGFFWHLRGHEHDGLDWLEKFLGIESDAPTAVRAKGFGFAGLFAAAAEYGSARGRAFCGQSLALAREAGDKEGVAWTLNTLGFFVETNLDRAIEQLDEGLALFRELENGWGMSQTLRGLGWRLMMRGEYGRARQLVEEALARAREVDDKNAIAWGLYLLGTVAWQESQDQAQAAVLYKDSLALSQVTRNKHQRAYALYGLAEVAEAQKDYEPAGAYYEEAFALWKDIGADWVFIGLPLFRLGQIAQAQGQYELARRRYEDVLALLREKVPDQHVAWAVAHGLWGLGTLANVQGDSRRAASLLGAADALVRSPEDLPRAFFARVAFDSDVASAQAELGDADFAHAFREGREMTMERAVAFALRASPRQPFA